MLTDEEGVSRELRAYRMAGGGAVVDCQPGGCGRDGRVLRRLSQRTGVHVVASTGFHRRVYYLPNWPLFAMSAEAAADYFRDEIANGLVETRTAEMAAMPVYPGVIKIAAEASLAASPRSLFEGAVVAANETGYAIEMHTERGAGVEEFLAFFSGQGLSPQRLVFCHVDKRPDITLHREMAQAGVMLEYDTFFRPKYEPERNVWPLIREMAAAGLVGQIALATDMADPGLWTELGGGPGMLGIFTIIRQRLIRLGLSAESIAGLLGENIGRRLEIKRLGICN
jgi:phosphotriesterase-related protein